jgi:hypothetical protein
MNLALGVFFEEEKSTYFFLMVFSLQVKESDYKIWR